MTKKDVVILVENAILENFFKRSMILWFDILNSSLDISLTNELEFKSSSLMSAYFELNFVGSKILII